MSTAVIDDSQSSIETEQDVRKLQELVKQLQHQNKVLLKRQDGSSNGLLSDAGCDVENMDGFEVNFQNGAKDLQQSKSSNSAAAGVLREHQFNSKVSPGDKIDCDVLESKITDAGEISKATDIILFDDVKLIDIDGISLDEEESW